jgi:hypothetical protein
MPQLRFHGAASAQTARAVIWELYYGGLPIATGRLASDQDVSFADVASLAPVMDSSGLTISVRYEDGEPCAIEVSCVRAVRPTTRAEATARMRWPGVRDQPDVPELRRRLLAETRDIHAPGAPGRLRCVCIYQPTSVLLEDRRLHLRTPVKSPQVRRNRSHES